MNPDDELCLCFHVKMRKVQNFCRIEKPRRASQLSECGGAGTGCGWCRPFLERIFENHQKEDPVALPSAEEYRTHRADYIRKKKSQRDDDR
ncbi:(2Fe-2S)-binding protein [Bremerella sp. T1]|uniref:(2Fe-2S)-binding protein n=1 Tax=Bremerella sp. TYQ1 TaxID=3119568 RepID=UPI001CD00C54|nr:(2Fe-2S)-binding protein [Bremerella volcania]UBM34879.1 (2Fe-2S)-binding protein [Bremerella volcania]